jgi:hypothetical protein
MYGSIEGECVTFIERVSEQTVPEGRFYPLYDGYSVTGYLFLTDEQRRVLLLEELIVLNPAPEGD